MSGPTEPLRNPVRRPLESGHDRVAEPRKYRFTAGSTNDIVPRMHQLHRAIALIGLAIGLLLGGTAVVAEGPVLKVPPAAEASPTFDPERATEAYLALVPPDQRARSDAYFEGSTWLQLWSSLYSIVTLGLLLAFGWSSRMRDLALRITNRRPLQTLIYWVQFVLYASVVSFPLTVYSGFSREHQYGLATQTFWPWMNEQLIGLAVTLVLGGLGMVVLYAVLRRVGRAWWLWATGVVVVFEVFAALIAPVFIAPLFNSYTPLTDSRVREPILRMARANGIDVDAVYVVDQSRQTTRVSANVSGLMGTTRISLNDNLLQRASLEEIGMVMGHEMGHYVLNHLTRNLLEVSLLIGIGLALSARAFEWFRQRRPQWGIASSADLAGLPLLVSLLTLYLLMVTPLTNTITRTSEYEADLFGLNVSRQPDGFANVTLKLGEYPKAFPWSDRGTHVLRSPERPDPHLHGHAVEGGKSRSRPFDALIRTGATEAHCVGFTRTGRTRRPPPHRPADCPEDRRTCDRVPPLLRTARPARKRGVPRLSERAVHGIPIDQPVLGCLRPVRLRVVLADCALRL